MDIDINVRPSDRKKLLKRHIRGYNAKTKDTHTSAIYLQDLPIDKLYERLTGVKRATIDYKELDKRGVHKVDILSYNALDYFDSKEELQKAIRADFDWTKLWDRELIKKLPEINNHCELIELLRPSNIQELADALALTKPGKKDLVDDYIRNPKKIRDEILYKKTDKYYLKKSHAIAYAMMIKAVAWKLTKGQSNP